MPATRRTVRAYPLDTRPPECIELDHYRIVHDLTWDALSDMMRRRQVYVGPTTLCYLLKSGPLTARPTDRTLHKIRRFIGHIRRLNQRRVTRGRLRARRRTAQVPRVA